MIKLRFRYEMLTLLDDLLEEAGAEPMHKQTRQQAHRIEQRMEDLLQAALGKDRLFTEGGECPSSW